MVARLGWHRKRGKGIDVSDFGVPRRIGGVFCRHLGKHFVEKHVELGVCNDHGFELLNDRNGRRGVRLDLVYFVVDPPSQRMAVFREPASDSRDHGLLRGELGLKIVDMELRREKTRRMF